jgi:5-methylcytosine-specific restriction endonuclease McrA
VNRPSGRRWQRMRAEILLRDGWRCAYCGGPANTVDHVRPLVEGGSAWHPANLVAACWRCNRERGSEVQRRMARKRDGLGLFGRSSMPPPPPRRRVRFGVVGPHEIA